MVLAGFCTLVLFNCKQGEGDKQKSTDLITIKTLGLAYLEEFKLEEAEEQFLRFVKLAPKEKLGYANLGLTYLRMGKYPEAEEQLLKSVQIDPKDPDIRLILATVYRMEDKPDEAIRQLKEALQSSPDHVKVIYELTEIYATLADEASRKEQTAYMLKLVEKAPENLVPRLNLTDIYIRNADFDAALEQLEIVQKQFPDFPREAIEYYDKTIKLLKKKDQANAIIQFTIFHNYLKVSTPYQAGIMDLKGPGGSLIGFPLITFDQMSSQAMVEGGSILEVMQFMEVSATAGLDVVPVNTASGKPVNGNSSHVEVSDFDSDGDMDLYVGSYDEAAATYKHYLFSNEMGRFKDITSESGLNHTGVEYSASFADYDNDGFLDLFIVKEGGNVLYRNAGKGTFTDVTSKTGTGSNAGRNKVLFFDLDHDGDLDLLETGSGSNMLFRNNADGTFLEQAGKMGIAGSGGNSHEAAFGDFDEDGDIDFIVAGDQIVLYSNQRQGIFKDVTEASGLTKSAGSAAIAVGDYNNDGFLDLFMSPLNGGDHLLYQNLRDGRFEAENSNKEVFSPLMTIAIKHATFLDVDNDGLLDLFIAGEPKEQGGRGLFLYHNDGDGKFSDLTRLLPEEPKTGNQVVVFDYNDDGDLDMAIAGTYGGVFLLRNDGGNNNHFIKMKLVGLKAGSAKNNHFGIGAKVEVRSGELYQTMVVTDPNVHFGLGNRSQADVVRITWTNGVPQNIFMPASNQALIEAQTLKGSCPFLYTWNGEKFVFVKDVLWRSALGMPLGIMGGTTAYGFADASDDYLKIPGELLKPINGEYRLQLTSELWETIYFDKLELVAVDHPDSVDIFVPEQFSPPPFPGRRITQVTKKHLPVSATDETGNDVLPWIKQEDDIYLSDFKPDKYQGITEMKDLILDPGKIGRNGNLFLFLNGWIFPTDASINVALSQSGSLKVLHPAIEVRNKAGEWVGIDTDMSFPMGKDKTVVVDLTGKFLSSDHRIRIRTNMEIYWDHVFFAEVIPASPMVSTVMKPARADIHYRGFSRSYRKGGRYGPHWFEYDQVDKGTRWRDLTGNYTRYGDVLPLLTASNNKYIISNAGDETTVGFNASELPELKNGWRRDFLIRSVGWVKDGDLNTATGNTVLPLPYHGMKSYPPGNQDVYPKDPELATYNREYNTRVVTAADYLNAIREMSLK